MIAAVISKNALTQTSKIVKEEESVLCRNENLSRNRINHYNITFIIYHRFLLVYLLNIRRNAATSIDRDLSLFTHEIFN